MHEIVQMTYHPSTEHATVAELLDFDSVRSMEITGRRRLSQRLDFEVLALVRNGTGHVSIDFRQHALSAGTAVWVHSGQVSRWTDIDRLDGDLALFRAGDVRVPSHVLYQSIFHLGDRARDRVAALFDVLKVEYSMGSAADPDAVPAVLPPLLDALLTRVTNDTGGGSPHRSPVFDAFRAAVEENFRHTRRVADYGRQLGYSPKTLTRATLESTGVGAKAFISQRVALEAERLLADSDTSIARCAQLLGFAEASNFSTFFRTQTGATPQSRRERRGL